MSAQLFPLITGRSFTRSIFFARNSQNHLRQHLIDRFFKTMKTPQPPTRAGQVLEAIALVFAEMQRQNDKWGEQHNSAHKWNSILGEEFGESCEAALNLDFAKSASERIESLKLLEEELVQTAAVAVQYAAALRVERMKLAEEILHPKKEVEAGDDVP